MPSTKHHKARSIHLNLNSSFTRYNGKDNGNNKQKIKGIRKQKGEQLNFVGDP